jgi:hypothetical protein
MSEEIARLIESSEPFFIGRIAGVELQIAYQHQFRYPDAKLLEELENNAGIHVKDTTALLLYSDMLIRSYDHCTIIAEWTGKVLETISKGQEFIPVHIFPIKYNVKSMRYLGNKSKHLEFIYSALNECFALINNNNPIIFDAFGGTGTVSQFLNVNNYQTVSNDINDYSYKLCYCRNSITKKDLTFCELGGNIENIITLLNKCKHKGFIYYNYSPNIEFNFERKYFTNNNAEIKIATTKMKGLLLPNFGCQVRSLK